MRRRTGIAIAVSAAVAASSVTGFLVVHRERQPEQNIYAARPTRFYEVPATQRFRYQTSRAGRDSWGRYYHLANASARLRHAMVPFQGQGYQLDDGDHDGWGVKRSLPDTLRHLRRAVVHGPPNRVWKMRPVKRKTFQWRFRKVDIDPAIKADTEGTNAIDIIVGSTLRRFPHAQLWGIYNCRYIAGTSSLSQHAYANAVDWGGSVALLDAVAKWQYAMARKGWLPLSQLLWRGHDWFSGGGVYDHYNHIHDSGKPLLGGGCHRPGSTRDVPIPTVTVAPLEGDEVGG